MKILGGITFLTTFFYITYECMTIGNKIKEMKEEHDEIIRKLEGFMQGQNLVNRLDNGTMIKLVCIKINSDNSRNIQRWANCFSDK